MNSTDKPKKDVFIKCLLLWIFLLFIPVSIATENNKAKRSEDGSYYMLPKNVIPLHYRIQLQPFIFPRNFTFYGIVNISIKCIESTNSITLHNNEINIHEDTIRIHGRNSVLNAQNVNYDMERQFMFINLDNPLSIDELYTISMEFTGNLNDQPFGFFRSSYTTSTGEERWVAATHFQPTDARTAFPCFDEPGMKATFDIVLIKPYNITALSNMPVKRVEQRDEFWEAVIFERTVPMSTYLVAFVICDYNYIQSGKIKVWTRAETLHNVQYALDTSTSLLSYFEEYFQIFYPLPKIDMVTVQDLFVSAMENWGLVTYMEPTLLYDPKTSSEEEKQEVSILIAHELAHQWFGNLVTPKYWDDTWLNEGFATFMAYVGVEHEFPEWQIRLHYITDTLQFILKSDSLENSHPVSLPLNNPAEVQEIFDMISYKKGASIIMMMSHFLGEKTFRRGITNYLRNFSYSNAAQDDLWAFLTAAQVNIPKNLQVDVKEVMDSWTLQTGYPLITVIRDYYSGNADIFQSRYLTDSDVKESYYWHVPITYTNAQELNWNSGVKMWLHKAKGTMNKLPSLHDWIILNIQQVGFYRVNYDERNWGLLASQLQQAHEKIHIINRAQILDDALDLARVDILDYNIALEMTLYLSEEEEYTPWAAFFNNMEFLEARLKNTNAHKKWKAYFTSKMQNIYKSLGWHENSDETLLKQKLRTRVLTWMCSYQYQNCVDKAVSMYKAWMHNSSNSIPSNLQETVFRTAIRHGSVKEWEFAWNRFVESASQTEAVDLLTAMAHTPNRQLLRRYLNSIFSSETAISILDTYTGFKEVASNPHGYDIAFNYFRENWGNLLESYGNTFFEDIATSTNTASDLAMLETLYENVEADMGEFESELQTIRQAIEEARSNVLWRTRNVDEIKTWLDSH